MIVPAYLHATRAMVCIALIFCVFAVITAILSLPCATALSDKQKILACRAAAVMEVLAGKRISGKN